jgi:hypothetical protein
VDTAMLRWRTESVCSGWTYESEHFGLVKLHALVLDRGHACEALLVDVLNGLEHHVVEKGSRSVDEDAGRGWKSC